MELIQVLNKRYSTKEFDSSKKISDENIEKIQLLLQLAPSSTNVQPWHFVLATSEDGRKRIAKSTQDFYKFNENKVLNSSAVVVFLTRTDINDEYLNHLLEKEEKDGRFPEEQFKNDNRMGRKIFVDIHKYDYKDALHWAEKQVYLNVGSFALGVAELGIDSVIMEGFDKKTLDEEFGLREKGFTSTIVVSLGYHSDNDFNAKLPKSRLTKEEIIEII